MLDIYILKSKVSMTCTKQEKLPPLTLLIGSSVRPLFCYSRALRPTWPYRKTAPTYSVNRFVRSSVILFFRGFPAYVKSGSQTYSTSFITTHKFSAIMRCPSSVGCMPSGRLSSGSPATPSRINGIKTTSLACARSENMFRNSPV